MFEKWTVWSTPKYETISKHKQAKIQDKDVEVYCNKRKRTTWNLGFKDRLITYWMQGILNFLLLLQNRSAKTWNTLFPLKEKKCWNICGPFYLCAFQSHFTAYQKNNTTFLCSGNHQGIASKKMKNRKKTKNIYPNFRHERCKRTSAHRFFV